MIVLKKFLFIISAIILISSVQGCKTDNSAEPETNSLVGTWTLTKITIPNGAASIILTPEQAQVQSTITAKADGTYNATVIDHGVTTTESGTYSVSGSVITFKMQDGTTRSTEFTLNGNKLTIVQVISTPLAENTSATLEFTRQ